MADDERLLRELADALREDDAAARGPTPRASPPSGGRSRRRPSALPRPRRRARRPPQRARPRRAPAGFRLPRPPPPPLPATAGALALVAAGLLAGGALDGGGGGARAGRSSTPARSRCRAAPTRGERWRSARSGSGAPSTSRTDRLPLLPRASTTRSGSSAPATGPGDRTASPPGTFPPRRRRPLRRAVEGGRRPAPSSPRSRSPPSPATATRGRPARSCARDVGGCGTLAPRAPGAASVRLVRRASWLAGAEGAGLDGRGRREGRASTRNRAWCGTGSTA